MIGFPFRASANGAISGSSVLTDFFVATLAQIQI
jgi:hypothetical protein